MASSSLPHHSVLRARSCAVTLEGDSVRLKVTPIAGEPVVVDFCGTDAEAVGWVMKKVGQRTRSSDELLAQLVADRDSLSAAIEIMGAEEGRLC